MAGHPKEANLAKRMIPVAKPFFTDDEVKAVGDVISSGWVAQGPKVKDFEQAFANYVGTAHGCAVSSCTAALHIALLAVGVKPGNIVITISHSFIATANCIRYCGAEPVFIDIDLATFNISAQHLSDCLERDCELRDGHLYYKKDTEIEGKDSPLVRLKQDSEYGRVAAILAVHQMGMPCDLRGIVSLAKRFNLPLVEDAACAVGSEILMEENGPWEKIGKPHGDIACFSFHPRKILATAEGGMLTTNNASLDQKFRLLRHQGMTISDLQRHKSKEILTEEYPAIGFNYRMTDMQAAIGIEQLKKIPAIISRRREIVLKYQAELKRVSWLVPAEEPAYCKTNWQSFCIRLLADAPMGQTSLMQYLLDNGVSTRPGVMNAHEELPYRSGRHSLRNSELARRSAVILPLFHAMTESEVYQIIELIKNA